MRKSLFIAVLAGLAGVITLAGGFFAHADNRGVSFLAKNTQERKRVALVIGNGSYRHSESMPRLVNPQNDADDMASALRQFGFEVTERKNLNKEEMEEAITDFGRRASEGDAALFYYSGHGLQVKGQNYLVPVDANIDSEAKVSYRAVNLNLLLEEMDSARSRVNIVMLDACRNNPISGKFRSGGTRGLASPSEIPKGTVIIYATAPGDVAADGEGRNGLFTASLLSAFRGRDLTLGGVLYTASKQVQDATGQQQTPYVNGPTTVQREFSFVQPSEMTNLRPLEVKPIESQPLPAEMEPSLMGEGGGSHDLAPSAEQSADTLAKVKSKGVLVAGVNGSLPPFGYIDEKSREIVGYDIDILRAIAKKLGVNLELKLVTSASRMPQLFEGDIDVIAADMTKNTEQTKQISFSYTYFVTGQKFLARKGTVTNLDALQGKKIGTARGSFSERNVKKAIPSATVLSFDDYPQAFLALQKKKVAAVSADEVILTAILAKASNRAQYEIPTVQISSEQHRFGIRKDDPQFVAFVNKTILEMERSGEADRTFQKWFGPGTHYKLKRNFKIEADRSDSLLVNLSPKVRVMPAPGKSFEKFMAEDSVCRQYAEHALDPTVRDGAFTLDVQKSYDEAYINCMSSNGNKGPNGNGATGSGL